MSGPVTLANVSKDLACNAVVDGVDAGAGPGYVEIQDVSNNVLATVLFPGAGSVAFEASGTNGTPGEARAFGDDGATPCGAGNPIAGSGSGDGEADHYVVFDDNDAERWRGDCDSTGSTAMTLDNVNIATAQNFNIVAWLHKVP